MYKFRYISRTSQFVSIGSIYCNVHVKKFYVLRSKQGI